MTTGRINQVARREGGREAAKNTAPRPSNPWTRLERTGADTSAKTGSLAGQGTSLESTNADSQLEAAKPCKAPDLAFGRTPVARRPDRQCDSDHEPAQH